MNSKLIENNYLVIPNFISDEKAKILAAEFKDYCESNYLPGDDQAPNSHAVYNHISFLELLCEKTPEVSTLLEETVLPTYSYARVYKEGSTLEKHTDRDACEISLTLHLDGDEPWPIWIENPKGEKNCVGLNPGDALLYLGKIAPHWREEYSGSYYSQVFLHYVRSRGECSYAYFDNREKGKIGIPDSEESFKKVEPEVQQTAEISEAQLPSTEKSKSIKRLDDFIKVYDNVVDVNLCDKILNEYQNCDSWQQTLVGEGIVDVNSRNCSSVQLSSPEIIDKNFEVRKFIDVELHEQLLEVVKRYSEEFSEFCPSIDTGYDLLRYETGQFYKQHTDSFLQQQRSISCSVCINDDYSGGEFAFFDREIVVKGKKGSVIVFPSNFMYPHEIMPVTSGVRYSIITWYV
jgi:predicted 2-oxoglutarate/Fe(II)-dependent dioxygenase YbiX